MLDNACTPAEPVTPPTINPETQPTDQHPADWREKFEHHHRKGEAALQDVRWARLEQGRLIIQLESDPDAEMQARLYAYLKSCKPEITPQNASDWRIYARHLDAQETPPERGKLPSITEVVRRASKETIAAKETRRRKTLDASNRLLMELEQLIVVPLEKLPIRLGSLERNAKERNATEWKELDERLQAIVTTVNKIEERDAKERSVKEWKELDRRVQDVAITVHNIEVRKELDERLQVITKTVHKIAASMESCRAPKAKTKAKTKSSTKPRSTERKRPSAR